MIRLSSSRRKNVFQSHASPFNTAAQDREGYEALHAGGIKSGLPWFENKSQCIQDGLRQAKVAKGFSPSHLQTKVKNPPASI